MEKIKCVGRRSITVEIVDGKVALIVHFKEKRIATLVMEHPEYMKLVKEVGKYKPKKIKNGITVN